ncbi:MAG: rod shape-determining protein RodA [Candidatus Tritonobacter lacicola]|nr:rod shape-determining protein RodA [Candidatus Tritonobacter lacicola]
MIQLSKRYDYAIPVCAGLLIVFGLMFIHSASCSESAPSPYIGKQLLWAAIGLLGLLILAHLDYRHIGTLAPFLYAAALVLLVAVLYLSAPLRGARSWLSLGPVSFQPSEFAKLAIIAVLAKFLSGFHRHRERLWFMAVPLLIVLLPVFLILEQPDLGSALILMPVLFSMLYVSGVKPRYLAFVFLLALLSLPVLWMFLRPYQQARLRIFINPGLDPMGLGYNAIQSKVAVGSGGFFGNGWLHGAQTHLKFLPERHTDFIFSVIGEEWGFAGGVVVIGLFMIIIFRGFGIAAQARDPFGRLLAVGVVVMLAAYVMINAGMTIGLMPITGLPFPLVSYGGSSLITALLSIGVLEGVRAKRYAY